MGKGDKRSKRGKIFAGSYGVTRPKTKGPTKVKAPAKSGDAKKPAAAKKKA